MKENDLNLDAGRVLTSPAFSDLNTLFYVFVSYVPWHFLYLLFSPFIKLNFVFKRDIWNRKKRNLVLITLWIRCPLLSFPSLKLCYSIIWYHILIFPNKEVGITSRSWIKDDVLSDAICALFMLVFKTKISKEILI